MTGRPGTREASAGDASRTARVPDAPVDLAESLLVAYKTGDDPTPYETALADASESALRRVREDRRTGLAFWINCYNAGTQRLLDRRPELYDSPLRSVRFFSAPAVTVAGTALSLDRIEWGVLLGGRSKFGLGYVPKLLVTAFERRYALDSVDPRVHFALNCGAVSCPAVRAYEPDAVDDQLDIATQVYLDQTVEYDPDAGVVRVPRVFLWFRGGFGGRAGIRRFLRRYDAIPSGSSPGIRYLDWDWDRDAGTFAD